MILFLETSNFEAKNTTQYLVRYKTGNGWKPVEFTNSMKVWQEKKQNKTKDILFAYIHDKLGFFVGNRHTVIDRILIH